MNPAEKLMNFLTILINFITNPIILAIIIIGIITKLFKN